MIVSARGIKAFLLGIGIIAAIILFLVIALHILLILLPILILIGIIGYIARKIHLRKKESQKEKSKDIITVKYKVKEGIKK